MFNLENKGDFKEVIVTRSFKDVWVGYLMAGG